MSTFGGILDEFPSISVDRFDNDNLNSTAFFLSHCHMDHMAGLQNPNGLPGPLYLSPISAVIIRKQFPQIEEIVELKKNEPTPIKYTDTEGITRFVTVTTVPAFHCPGSVMFLFEEDSTKVLYTGDFRLSKRHTAKIKRLKSLIGSIDTMYIDSTFMSADYQNFPQQIRSALTICNIIKDWLDRSSQHVISLKMPARYGYEFLFIEIGKKLNPLKIHINEEEMVKYKYIPELDNILTSQACKSRIHACFDYHNKNGKSLTCNPDIDPTLIRVIKPTAMIWKDWRESKDFVKHEANGNVRVCYSNHCSMSEIRDFLHYVQPKTVQLNVVPTDAVKKRHMLDALSRIMGEIHSTSCRHKPTIHLCNWDNLGKISKLNFKFSKSTTKVTNKDELLVGCPPKRKKI